MPRRYDSLDYMDYDEDGDESYSEDTGYEEEYADSDSYDSDHSGKQTRIRWSNNESSFTRWREDGANDDGVFVLQSLTKPAKQAPVESLSSTTPKKTWGCIAVERPVSILDLQEEEHRNKIREEERKKQEEISRQIRNASSSQHKRLLSKDDTRYDLLCVNGPKHRCKMAHDFKQWKPRLCRFHRCKNGPLCIYWHSKSESLKDYLARCCNNEKSFFYKNRNQFLKYYLDLKS